MKVIKIAGKEYDPNDVEINSKIVRKWLVINQINKIELSGKYHTIFDEKKVDTEYTELMAKIDQASKQFFSEYVGEPWENTFPIMKDVSRVEKLRVKDGVEFCVLI